MRGVSAANFPSEQTNHIDPSENALSRPSRATYSQLRRISSAFPGVTLRDPEQPVKQPEPAPLLGVFSGEPILPLPDAAWGLPDRSSASSGGALSDFLAGLSWRNPAMLPSDDDRRGSDGDDQAQPGSSKGSARRGSAAALLLGATRVKKIRRRPSRYLTRRANHLHIVTIATIQKPAPGNRPRAFSVRVS